jgi:2-polyprenyl-3-methyl-5-hydroxy-6-metoxy-1,4-benzoquinol methylase
MNMDGRYWDRLAPKWDEEIFNSLAADRDKVIVSELRKAARGMTSAADFGCGIGIYLPALARLFAEVHGFEQSAVCAAHARRRMRSRAGVTVHATDRAPRQSRGRFDVVICINAAIHPHKRVWSGVLRSACALLKPRGRLLVVVPALESAELVAAAQRRLKASGKAGNGATASLTDRRRGIVRIDGVRTKHFRRRELADALAAIGVGAIRVRRVRYSWRSEAVVPPTSMRKTRPWDWIAVGTLGAAAAPP